MSINSENFMQRIKEGVCPICFKEVTKESKVVEDPKYGPVPICNHHAVNITANRVEVKTCQ